VFRSEREGAAGARTVVLRELGLDGAVVVLRRGDEFSNRVFDAAATPDGGLFFAVGRAAGAEEHVLRAYDGKTGAVCWARTTGTRDKFDSVIPDADGRLLACAAASGTVLRHSAGGEEKGTYPYGAACLGPSEGFALCGNAGVAALAD